MTCEQSRSEYIAAVENLCDATREIGKLREGYVDKIRSAALDDVEVSVREWQLYLDTLRRLIADQQSALDYYRSDSSRHTPVPDRGIDR